MWFLFLLADNLLFFGTLLNKCATQERMIVCAFTLRMNTETNLCYMIPNGELGGFYLSKIAYQGMSNYISRNNAIGEIRLKIFLTQRVLF